MKKKTILLLLALVLLIAVLAVVLLVGRAPAPQPAENTPEPAAQETGAESTPRAPVPTAAAFAEDFFRVVGRFHPGTAGSSLGRALAACGAYRFAAENKLADTDPALLSAALREGRTLLSEEERGWFDENVGDVAALIETCQNDWEEVRPLFDDAGVAEDMDALLKDPAAPDAWSALCGAISEE